jgi:hypothetical protein
MGFLRTMLDWSEVWAPLIPLIFLVFNPQQPRYLKPVITYLVIAFCINLAGDMISDYRTLLPISIESNNPLYNIHSLVRLVCFYLFFVALGQTEFVRVRYILTALCLVVIIVNFMFNENFLNPSHLSGNLLAAEAYLLLIYCLLYYLSKLRSDESDAFDGPDFWVVTGLSVYVVINFFVFLFYVPMITLDSKLAERIWDFHNIAYIILCILITRAFYVSARHKFAV